MTTQSKGLPLEWTQNLKGDVSKKKFEEAIRNSVHSAVWDRLKEILAKRLEANSKTRASIKEFDQGSWAYKQAYLNGIEASLQSILDLITIEKE